MHFSSVIYLRLALLLFMINSFNPLQAEKSDIYSENVVKFEINPLVCMVEKIGDQCHLKANLHWQTKQLMSVCLVQKNTVIQCWDEEKEIKEKLVLYLTETTKLHMADESNKTIASVRISVNAIEPNKRRRRLRSAWGVF